MVHGVSGNKKGDMEAADAAVDSRAPAASEAAGAASEAPTASTEANVPNASTTKNPAFRCWYWSKKGQGRLGDKATRE